MGSAVWRVEYVGDAPARRERLGAAVERQAFLSLPRRAVGRNAPPASRASSPAADGQPCGALTLDEFCWALGLCNKALGPALRRDTKLGGNLLSLAAARPHNGNTILCSGAPAPCISRPHKRPQCLSGQANHSAEARAGIGRSPARLAREAPPSSAPTRRSPRPAGAIATLGTAAPFGCPHPSSGPCSFWRSTMSCGRPSNMAQRFEAPAPGQVAVQQELQLCQWECAGD